MSIVTLPDFKAYIRDEGNGLDDVILQGYLDSVTQWLGAECGREWVVAPVGATARSFQPSGWSQTLVIDDCTTITSVVDNGVTLVAGTDYQAEPLNHRSVGQTVPYYKLYKPNQYWITNSGFASAVVTATWGWLAFPVPIIQACLVSGKELCNNQDVRLGIAGAFDGAFSGIRRNPIVDRAINAFKHPDSIGVG